VAKSGDELVGETEDGGCKPQNDHTDALLKGQDLVSDRVKAERAIAIQIDKAAAVMTALLALDPVDRFMPSDSGEPNMVSRPNVGAMQLQWKIAQYILDAAMDRLPTPIANTGRSIVVRTVDPKQLQAELAKRLRKAA
jgi:hypothetical protein